MKEGWTAGSGHGPQWGTWALMIGRINKSTRSKGNFIVGSDNLKADEKKQIKTYIIDYNNLQIVSQWFKKKNSVIILKCKASSYYKQYKNNKQKKKLWELYRNK